MSVTTLESRDDIIKAMQTAEFYDHEVSEIVMLQTHISWVFLTGEYAYKVKKPMDFGFLNFTELSQRQHFCEEEIRLNKRLASDVYIETVRITGTLAKPSLNGDGDAIEYAVKMRQFEQSQLADTLLSNDLLTAHHIDNIADQAANFHQSIRVSGNESELGTASSVNAPVIQNFDQLDPMIKDEKSIAQLSRLRDWSEKEFNKISSILKKRKESGFVRECHGDMHLGNMALINKQITIFDGIEFNDEFRWIDVMSEVAFLFMDLFDRGQKAYAYRFLNRYLEQTGDYEGIQVLRFYLVYRAMVRAKIASFTLLTPNLSAADQEKTMQQYTSYSNLAESFTQIDEGISLSITHGVSGSGKTTVSQQLLEGNGAIRIRSDIERKRLYQLKATENSKSPINSGIYTAEANSKTYLKLEIFAKLILSSGFSCIADATFLDRENRLPFQELAVELAVKYTIIDFDVDEAEFTRRIIERSSKTDNTSEADIDVLKKQLSSMKPLEDEEKVYIQKATF